MFDRSLLSLLTGALLLGAAPAHALQFDVQWVTFTPEPGMLSAGTISGPSLETDLAWADADNDGWTDVAVARKQPFTSPGKRTNVFLHNSAGVLTDQTALFASAADIAGDLGFLTPTNDRDVAFLDVDADGWADMVTAPCLSSGDPKHIGHPRVYRNLGPGSGGIWAGFRFEDARIPQLLHYSTGLPQNPRFMEVAGGDLTADGSTDLFFSDHDSTGSAPQPVGEDLDNRLLVNGGSGFFTDQSLTSMPADMHDSGFSTMAEAVDLNGDGFPEIVETEGYIPNKVAAFYNAWPTPGSFSSGQGLFDLAPYSAATGDLNNDGRPDLVVGSDSTDRYLYNLGNDALGMANFGVAKTFKFLSGGDDGFAGNVHVEDLDGDGWRDVLICDVDFDIASCARRLHIYHNPGGAQGTQITLVEERENSGSGWLGVEGMHLADLKGVNDVAVLDIDGDGDRDLLVSRCTGTFAWSNQTVLCQKDIGSGGPGAADLSLCGDELSTGGAARLELVGAPPSTVSGLAVGVTNNPIPLLGGMLVPSDLALVQTVFTDANGEWQLSVPGGMAAPVKVYFQAAYLDTSLTPFLLGFTNAVEAQFLP